MPQGRTALVLALLFAGAVSAAEEKDPPPTGRLVDLGGHRLHLDCRGTGGPTVVFENGLGDFSFDWALVARELEREARICVYDRAGYAWSDPGPLPRTFAQLNLELHDALALSGEKGPFLLVGHSFGGAVVRAHALMYPREVLGMVLVDSVEEHQRIPIAGRAVPLSDGARGRPIPKPRETLEAGDLPPAGPAPLPPPRASPLASAYAPLPDRERALHMWAQSRSELERAEASQREWSAEQFTLWRASPSEGTLGSIPLIVLAREKGGYSDRLDVPPAELDAERLEGQARLARMSTRGRRILLSTGHAMHLEAPRAVAEAVRQALTVARRGHEAARRDMDAARRDPADVY